MQYLRAALRKDAPKQRFYLTKSNFLSALAVTAILCVALFFAAQHYIYGQVLTEYKEVLRSQLALRQTILRTKLQDSQRHVLLFSHLPDLQTVVAGHSGAATDFRSEEYLAALRRLQILFKEYVESHGEIAQLRLIQFANNGQELVRANRRGDQVSIVAGTDLQAKGDRDYVAEVLDLEAGQIYLSDINLNREFGQIEQPSWPTYRIAIKIQDSDDKDFGIIIANFLAQKLLDEVRQNQRVEEQIFLLNQDGYFLVHPEPEKAFAFEFGESQSWQEQYQQESAEAESTTSFVRNIASGQQLLVAKATVELMDTANRQSFQLIVAVNQESLNHEVFNRMRLALGADIILFAVAATLLFLYWRFSQASLATIETQAGFEAIVHGSNEAIIATSAKGLVQTWNEAAEQLFNKNEAQAIGQHLIGGILVSDNKAEIENKFELTLQGERLPYFVVNIVDAQGQPAFLAVNFSPIFSAKQNVKGVAAIIRDITDAITSEREMQKLNHQLQVKNQELQQFIYTVSHDLKSPLITLNSFSRSVLDSPNNQLDDRSRHRLERLIVNIDHMDEMLGELLQLSRLLQKEIDITDCDISQCVKEASENLEQLLKNTGATISVQEDMPLLHANPRLVVQCLQNLIANAATYTREGVAPHLEISAEETADEIRVSIKDNGAGIDNKYFGKIFHIFERLGPGEGSGVGLAIVKSAMEKHNGRVELESTPGVGSVFVLIFPNPNR